MSFTFGPLLVLPIPPPITLTNISISLLPTLPPSLTSCFYLDQLPAGRYVPGLLARPWHDQNQSGSPAAELAPAMHAMEAQHASLTAEFRALQATGITADNIQNECLHVGAGWYYVAVAGKHAILPDHASGCHPQTPVACALARELDSLDAGFVRLGYSEVLPGTHIQPHWGPTNTLLKVHLGLIVPSLPTGVPCTSIRVGGEERVWAEGVSVLFDDSFQHSVWNNCTGTRVVLQAVFEHPGIRSMPSTTPSKDGSAAIQGQQGAFRSEL